MSRFADPAARREVDFGECLCPGAPHDHDWAKVRAELAPREIGIILGITEADGEEAALAKILPFITEWNLLGPNGEPWPPSVESLQALKGPTMEGLIKGIIDSATESNAVPNPSGAPSAASSRGSASRARKRTQTPGT